MGKKLRCLNALNKLSEDLNVESESDKTHQESSSQSNSTCLLLNNLQGAKIK